MVTLLWHVSNFEIKFCLSGNVMVVVVEGINFVYFIFELEIMCSGWPNTRSYSCHKSQT